MSKSISISFGFGDAIFQIGLKYAIQVQENTQTISCSVEGLQLPLWLQLRKFEVSSLNEQNVFVPLYNEVNNGKNMATVLFIDKAYFDIMRAEKLQVATMA
jgi:hypothetical protein